MPDDESTSPTAPWLTSVLSVVSAVLAAAGYRSAVVTGRDLPRQRLRLQRVLARTAVDLFFAWRLSRLLRRGRR